MTVVVTINRHAHVHQQCCVRPTGELALVIASSSASTVQGMGRPIVGPGTVTNVLKLPEMLASGELEIPSFPVRL